MSLSWSERRPWMLLACDNVVEILSDDDFAVKSMLLSDNVLMVEQDQIGVCRFSDPSGVDPHHLLTKEDDAGRASDEIDFGSIDNEFGDDNDWEEMLKIDYIQNENVSNSNRVEVVSGGVNPLWKSDENDVEDDGDCWDLDF
eukprot:GHVH01016801.1.p2 GENE.GHVH01016801.1~~GHVH01016801.1.p2  ORF type:complete len:142 (-),score=35.87 GHVH01016801.1:1253-1678(-)